LVDFYENNIGCIIQERAAGGIASWEGLVQEMRLVIDGVEYMMTLRPDRWHNNVKIIYRSIVNGSRQTVDWLERTDASEELGEMQMILTLGAATSAAATALQSTELNRYAWPWSRMIGGVTIPREVDPGADRLLVKCCGFWHTLNWLYQETSLSDTATNLVTTLAGNSEFVTAGRIEANTLSTYVEADPNPQRLGDAIEDLIAQGDSSYNVWQGGVYADRELVYEQAPQSVDYWLTAVGLCDKTGVEVHPCLLDPGFLMYNASAPVGVIRPGTSSDWDNPQVAYVEQVEFVAPRGLRLRLYDEEETIAVLGEQISRESYVGR
jgi:hypothetical protein